MYELSQRFTFDAAHTLRREIEPEGSARIHGHTYSAEVTVAGAVEPDTGMVLDLGTVRARIARVRERLDHRFLDDVEGLGTPTLENLCAFIAAGMDGLAAPVVAVRVWRESSGDACTMRVTPHAVR